jgi:hypothetical protein
MQLGLASGIRSRLNALFEQFGDALPIVTGFQLIQTLL